MNSIQSAINRSKGSGNKFNPAFIGIAANLKSAGCPDTDISLALGVKPSTIDKWKNKFPAFKEALENGKTANLKVLLATTYRAAIGYDYDETTRYYEYRDVVDEETGEVKQVEKQVKKTVKTKHHPANPDLLKFLLINESPDFTDSRKEVVSKSYNLDMKGDAVDIIEKMGAKYFEDLQKDKKKIEDNAKKLESGKFF